MEASVNDRSAFVHVRKRTADEMKHRDHVHAERLLYPIVVDVLEALDGLALVGGVVDEDVDPSEELPRRRR